MASDAIEFLPIGFRTSEAMKTISQFRLRRVTLRPLPKEPKPRAKYVTRLVNGRKIKSKEHVIEAIIGSAVIEGKFRCLVQWKGYPEKDNRFEPIGSVDRTVAFFWFKYPLAQTSAGCSGKWCSMEIPNNKNAMKVNGRHTAILRRLLDLVTCNNFYDSRVGFFRFVLLITFSLLNLICS